MLVSWVCLFVRLFAPYSSQLQFNSSLHQPVSLYTSKHCAHKKLISFRESRSKINQDIGQSAKIQHCEIGHSSNCLCLAKFHLIS